MFCVRDVLVFLGNRTKFQVSVDLGYVEQVCIRLDYGDPLSNSELDDMIWCPSWFTDYDNVCTETVSCNHLWRTSEVGATLRRIPTSHCIVF